MRGGGKFLRSLLSFGLLVLPPLLIVLSLERVPLVTERETSVFGDVKSAKAILARLSPGDLVPNRVTPVTISESELNSAVSAALFTTPWLKARVDIGGGELEFMATASTPLPKNPLGHYLNARVNVPESDKGFKVRRISVGRVPIPTFVVRPVLIFAMDQVLGSGKGKAFYESVRYVSISGNQLTVGLRPPAGFKEDIKEAAKRTVLVADIESVRAYYERLVSVAQRGGGRVQSLAAYIGPSFTLAKARSRTRSPVDENEAVILALALYFGDSRFETLLSDVKTEALKDTRGDLDLVKLEGRTDWVQHFVTSAGLMAAGGTTVSDVLGQAKEVLDSEGPSGFSFTDIGADHAGIRFAQVATASRESALHAQNALAGSPRESTFFPRVGDLPEGLSEEEFRRRYGDVNSPAYKAVLDEIDRRLDAIALYR